MELNQRTVLGRYPEIPPIFWKLSNTLLNNPRVKEITRKMGKYFSLIDSENTTHPKHEADPEARIQPATVRASMRKTGKLKIIQKTKRKKNHTQQNSAN